MQITVMCQNDYLRYENNEPLVFRSINEMITFFDEKNCTMKDLRRFDFNIEDME